MRKPSNKLAVVSTINECRFITKDWWRQVKLVQEDYGVTPSEEREFYFKHQRFVSIVKPLDLLEGYNADNEVYEMNYRYKEQNN